MPTWSIPAFTLRSTPWATPKLAIMVAHVAFAGEDGLPSTLSPQIITGLLREELGYRGLVVSDCMEMDAIRANFGVAPGAGRPDPPPG